MMYCDAVNLENRKQKSVRNKESEAEFSFDFSSKYLDPFPEVILLCKRI